MQISSISKKKESIDTLNLLIRKESRAAALFVHTVAKSMNMHITDIKCLDYLIDTGSATAGNLAKITGLTTGATTAMIDRLEKANFIRRENDPKDRRKIIIVLTTNNSCYSKITNKFFTKKIPKLLVSYTEKERRIIATWNEEMANLFQNEVEELRKIK